MLDTGVVPTDDEYQGRRAADADVRQAPAASTLIVAYSHCRRMAPAIEVSYCVGLAGCVPVRIGGLSTAPATRSASNTATAT
jgi:hypothetical protein